ncbi:MAG: nitrous oxide reductase family maturation protein NosD, partial [Promethearchaeota archaeon]
MKLKLDLLYVFGLVLLLCNIIPGWSYTSSQHASFEISRDEDPFISLHFRQIQAPLSSTSSQYTPHTPIEATNDTELEAVANSGTGIKSDPFIIEGWNITTNGEHGIHIRHTTVHFIIRNCWIMTGSIGIACGIHTRNITTGTVIIVNNTCQESYCGIFLEYSENSTVANNICRNNRWGIKFFKSGNSTVRENICIGNNRDGMDFDRSGNMAIIKNVCNQNNDTGMYLFVSNNLVITDNSFQINEDDGLHVDTCRNLTIMNNTYTRNKANGLFVWLTKFCMITDNICNENFFDGIKFMEVQICVMRRNLLLENQEYGIDLDLDSTNNSIYHNSFLNNNDNGTQAADDGFANQWFNESILEGNYWGDYLGSGVYQLAGSSGSLDPYPLDDVLDSDVDGMPDGWEYKNGFNTTNPLDAFQDADDDGMQNLWEYQMRLDPRKDDAAADLDGDTLTNLLEFQLRSWANQTDTDRDGMPDLYEFQNGLKIAEDDAD